MKSVVEMLKAMSDPTRLRMAMVLMNKELCVCQIMGVLGISQPLVSRNLRIMDGAGFLEERRDGKLVYYSIKRNLEPARRMMLEVLKEALHADTMIMNDGKTLKECEAFQKTSGRCDMKTLAEFMARKRA